MRSITVLRPRASIDRMERSSIREASSALGGTYVARIF